MMIEEIQLRANEGRCKAPKDMTLLEVGAFAGEATVIFCEHFKEISVVDPWLDMNGDITDKVSMNEVFQKFYKNLIETKKVKANNMHIGFFEFIVKENINVFDIIYIDALHDYGSVKDDIIRAKKMLIPGGIISGHDYNENRFPGVVQAVDELLGGPEIVTPDMSWFRIME